MTAKTALILAAGNGTRLQVPPQYVPKPLVSVGGMPLLRRVIRDARQAGIHHFVIVIGKQGRSVQDYFAQRPVAGVVLDWVSNEEYEKANGVSALKARHHLRESFLLLMADHIFQPRTARALLQKELLDGEVILGIDRKISKIFDIEDATKVRLVQNRIMDIGKMLTDYDAIDTGMFLCSPALFDALEASMMDGNCSLSDGMRYLAERGRLRAFDIQDADWFDVDTPQAALHAEQWLSGPFDTRVTSVPAANDTDGEIQFAGIGRPPSASECFLARH